MYLTSHRPFHSGGDGVRLPAGGGDTNGAPLQPAAAAERVRRPLPGPQHTAALQRPEKRRHETTKLYVDGAFHSLEDEKLVIFGITMPLSVHLLWMCYRWAEFLHWR